MSRSAEHDDDRPPPGNTSDRKKPGSNEPGSGQSGAGENTSPRGLTDTFHEIQSGLRNFLRSRLPQQADVDDCLQRVFLATLNQQRPIPPVAHRAWLYRVAATESARWWREKSREERATRNHAVQHHANDSWHPPASISEPTCRDVDPSQLLETEETLEQVRKAIARLPPETRQILRKRLHDGMTFQAIAEEMQVPLGTVLTRTRRALERIRCDLERD
jgi:RNA polymerase sigma-70 factor (ECF subfamily)